MSLPKILAIVGPTGSGKTSLSIILAERMHGEIISADSRQIYKHLDIGTAKPTAQELQRVPHHFIGMFEPSEEYNAGMFGKDARITIKQIFARKKLPLLVGGSGLYLKAVIDGLFEGPGKDPEIRTRLEERLTHEGAKALFEELKKIDPVSAANAPPTKPRRIIRALEVYYITGQPISQLHAEQRNEPEFDTVQFALAWDRKALYARINQRVDTMITMGLVDEVKGLGEQGYDIALNALNTVGYKEVFNYLDDVYDYEEMVRLIKQNTRRFAKRQLTWFRADKKIQWIAMHEGKSLDEAAEEIRKRFFQ